MSRREAAGRAIVVDRESGKNWDFAINPKLVKTVGNYWPYATTLYDYTYRAMPFMQPGTLTADETYALTAYILNLNETSNAAFPPMRRASRPRC